MSLQDSKKIRTFADMTKTRRFLLLLLTALTPAARGMAQEVPSVIAEHYTTADGLPSDNVMCALRSRDGFLWLGTWYGLCRFDGGRFVTFNRPVQAASDNPPRRIESMAEDERGQLWLKTVDWKLFVFNPRTERFRAVHKELKQYTTNLQVIKIQPTGDGGVLLLTKDKSLLMARTGADGQVSIRRLIDAKGKTDPQTLRLREDIVAESGGYEAYQGRDYRIYAQRKGRLTLAEAMANDSAADSRRVDMMRRMAAEAGIGRYQQLYMDRDSMLWVATASHGVYSVCTPRHTFRLITLPGGQTGVRCIYQTRRGDIIVGSRSRDAYIYRPDGQLMTALPYERYGIGAIYHAAEDSRGRMWLATKGDGLVLATPDSSRPTGYRTVHYRHDKDNPASISGDNVYYIFIDSRNRIWAATLDGGLNLISEEADGRLTFYHKRHGFSHYPSYGLYTEARNITEDSKGRIWIGTIDGLMSIDGHFRRPEDIRFTTYQNTPMAAFANNDIYTLHRDAAGQIWVGAFGGGLQRLLSDESGIRFEPLGTREGLRSDVISSMTDDQHGRLWFATEVGLSCYNQQDGRIRNFDRYDGLPDVQMEETSAMCARDGNLWIGTRQGILVFSPLMPEADHKAYPTYIISLTTDNQPYAGAQALPYCKDVELEHRHNSFTIEFAALKYQDNAQLSYRYRLEGFDRDWHYGGPVRVASYNEVPPGSYTFVVEAIDNADADLQSSAVLRVRILPPWWATWWAYLIYICAAAVVAWLIVRTAVQMNRMRNEIYISQRLAKLTSRPDEGDEFIDRLHRIIRQNIANSDFVIDDMAAEMSLSRSAFYKKVKALTGFAPVDLIKEFRLSHAAELLRTTNHSITETAYRSGFKDASYFGKCFRKRYGMSPREYANQQ